MIPPIPAIKVEDIERCMESFREHRTAATSSPTVKEFLEENWDGKVMLSPHVPEGEVYIFDPTVIDDFMKDYPVDFGWGR